MQQLALMLLITVSYKEINKSDVNINKCSFYSLTELVILL